MITRDNMTEKQLIAQLILQLDAASNTLLKLRKPETAYETMRANDSLRQVYQWVADGYGLIKFAKDE